MATITPAKATVPVLTKNQGLFYETAAIASGDDLNLAQVESPSYRLIKVTPAASVTPLATLTSGHYPGQRVTLAVTGVNTLRLPAVLANLDVVDDVSVSADIPVTLVWSGTGWEVASDGPLKRSLKMTFDFAVDGGVVGAITPDGGAVIPDNAIVMDGFYEVETTFTSPTADTATIALSLEGADDLIAAVDIADVGNPWDAGAPVALLVTGAAATFIKMTAANPLVLTVAVEDITAGKLHVHLDYVIGVA